jgi:hypothetical protein
MHVFFYIIETEAISTIDEIMDNDEIDAIRNNFHRDYFDSKGNLFLNNENEVEEYREFISSFRDSLKTQSNKRFVHLIG